MIVKVLVENQTISDKYGSEHGLSLYVQTKQHKLLFDVGASSLFAENAEEMGVDLAEIDLVVISHGHYDHGGGLRAFLECNSTAKVYVHHKAFSSYYAQRPSGEQDYIGLDQDLIHSERLFFVGDHLLVNDELELFATVSGENFKLSGNQDLLMESAGSLVLDSFAHEQNLLIKEEGKILLIAGCAHRGIPNILEGARALVNRFPDYVIGGFHLYNPSRDKGEEPGLIGQIGDYLLSTGAQCYTCHCTGIKPYNMLREIMDDKITYLATGSELTL